MKFGTLAALLAFSCLAGCAEQSAMRVAQDTVRINVSTAPIYGTLEPQRRAMRMAADETLKSGYDKFLIVDGVNTFKPNVIGQTAATYQSSSQASVVGSSSGFYGHGTSQATYVGPQPVAMPRFESAITVKMFKNDDLGGANALDARQVIAQNAQ